MATDTAFAVALVVMLGRRVPVELRVFLTAASIVDDIGAIVVVALFYSGDLQWSYLGGAVLVTLLLWLLNRAGVYRAMPYGLLGIALWDFIHAGGLHATLAGVVLALFISTRPPPNLAALTAQATRSWWPKPGVAPTCCTTVRRSLRCVRSTRSTTASNRRPTAAAGHRAVVELPGAARVRAGQCRRRVAAVFAGREALLGAIGLGLIVGKPFGFLVVSSARRVAAHGDQAGGLLLAAAVRRRCACRRWVHYVALHRRPGIPGRRRLRGCEGRVFAASMVSAIIGVAILWRPRDKGGNAVDAEARAAERTAEEPAPARASALAMLPSAPSTSSPLTRQTGSGSLSTTTVAK